MTYSAFDMSQRAYRVYQDNQPDVLMTDPRRCRPLGMSPIGADVTLALCPLPAQARPVGWSREAVGTVVRMPHGYAGVPQGYRGGVPGLGLGGLGYAQPGWMPPGAVVATSCPHCQALGQEAPPGMRALTFKEALVASAVINIVAGIVSTLFLRRVFKPT